MKEACTGSTRRLARILSPVIISASSGEVDQAAQLASEAFSSYSQTSGAERARFLRKIAENIEGLGDLLITRAIQETGLPEGRIRTETGRTCGQLRLFASLVEEGSWVDARIDHADPTSHTDTKARRTINVKTTGPSRCFWREQLSTCILGRWW